MTTHSPFHSLPLAQRDNRLWDAVLAEGFARIPGRRENYDKAQAAPRAAIVEHLPVQMDIEVTSRCNYRCIMCMINEFPKYSRAPDLGLDDYKAILDSQYGLIEVKLQGIGEPTLSKDFPEMVRYARQEKFLWVRSTTNASRLHKDDMYKQLIDADICELQVSIDGVSPETYETIRPGGKWELVEENCRLLNTYAQGPEIKRTRMWSVVQRKNFDELERFPEAAARMGFERLTFALDLAYWGQEKWKELNATRDMAGQFNLDLAARLMEEGRRHGIEVTFWYTDSKYHTDDPKGLCPWLFGRTYVASDMRTVPCCSISNPDFYEVGDAHDLVKVWNDTPMQELRQAHLEGRIPEICKACYR